MYVIFLSVEDISIFKLDKFFFFQYITGIVTIYCFLQTFLLFNCLLKPCSLTHSPNILILTWSKPFVLLVLTVNKSLLSTFIYLSFNPQRLILYVSKQHCIVLCFVNLCVFIQITCIVPLQKKDTELLIYLSI